MAFTASDVKELREMTGCGMMDCKKALTETDGDKDKAVELLRERVLQQLLRSQAESHQRVSLSHTLMAALVLLLRLTQRQTSLQRTQTSRISLLMLLRQ